MHRTATTSGCAVGECATSRFLEESRLEHEAAHVGLAIDFVIAAEETGPLILVTIFSVVDEPLATKSSISTTESPFDSTLPFMSLTTSSTDSSADSAPAAHPRPRSAHTISAPSGSVFSIARGGQAGAGFGATSIWQIRASRGKTGVHFHPRGCLRSVGPRARPAQCLMCIKL
ncbi:hypothetical protein WL88_00865 [Burkholderia diffusa]|uniref:Uncharacterized protein n=1 Tax=Burkholderia diffusa TaxID=488732 RepID=A0AAW3PIR3_9BURK|nr:hypothetical protein WL85_13470 [Burkholderia diffusa]KWF42498.1 hypothetical protein WL86_12595 [Burkholderia diffusa]KWF48269.1 hypothetical protein WL87_19030 [Burkholderia diffusa]KWF55551.1 hypothetical protein WL88_00865 [Burkholderia diffusa]